MATNSLKALSYAQQNIDTGNLETWMDTNYVNLAFFVNSIDRLSLSLITVNSLSIFTNT